jgi:molecular chaperone GrpE
MSKGRKSKKESTKADKAKVDIESIEPEDAPDAELELEEKFKIELEEQRRLWIEREDQLLRSLSEKENQVKRMSRDLNLAKSRQKGEMALPLLDILDGLDRALGNRPEEVEASFIEGLELLSRHFHEALEGLGLKSIVALGEIFDPEFHEALLQLPGVDAEKGTVIQELQKGYLIDGRVLRPSKVAVAG